MRVCDYQPNTVVVEGMPSQTTLLLSDDECVESNTDSNWWVKLRASARLTSTERLSIQGILSKADSWIRNPSENTAYVAPNLKIVGAGLKNTSSPMARCSLLQLPGLARNDILYTVPRESVAMNRDQNAQCHDGILIKTYSKRAGEFSYQCADLRDAAGKPYKAQDVETVSMNVTDTPRSCSEGKIVSGLYLKNSNGGEFIEGATLTCARFKNEAGTLQLTPAGTQSSNRWIHFKEHFNTCERPTNQGPIYLLTPPNGFMTGLDVSPKETQWWCSEFTPGPSS